jgi:N-acetylated-alpha-linked acidic dipeptidase
MKQLTWTVSLALMLFSVDGFSQGDPKPLRGFSSLRAAEQHKLEAALDSLGKPENFRLWMQRLAARPHPVGSPHGKENAEFIAGLFRSWGYTTRIEPFQILFPTPRRRRLELLAPTPYSAQLKEPALGLPWTPEEQLPPYNAYSIDGDVTGELVYVNYGLPEDYEELRRHGVSVEGRIVLARYGQSWRGIKPKLAAEHGAIGCILYSDPDLDGYALGDVYPQGAYRPDQSVQLGSVLDIPIYPGDPLTPFTGSTPGAKRLPREQAATLTRIPVLPISYGDALPLLKALGGPVAPQTWRGALPVTYHLGPGPARVHLELAFDWRQVTAYDVIATLAGAEQPDEWNHWILRGNHHDAWIAGATDPVSGLVALLEEARLVGELARQGHRPRRTIVYAAWDAEEPGFIGSTEWAETNAEELRRKAAVYVNTDSNARGFLSAGGSLTLQRFLHEVARDVIDPQAGVSVLDRALARVRIEGAPPGEPTVSREVGKTVENAEILPMEPLGSGSDFAAFLDHLGIASLDFSYCCESDYGVYHSAYDSFEHFTRFVDPKFEYETTQAQTSGRVVLRLANADVLPFEFSGFADRVGAMVDEIAQLADRMRIDTDRQNEWIQEDLYRIIADTRHPFVSPLPQKPVPFLTFAPLRNAIQRLKTAGSRYEKALALFSQQGEPFPPELAGRIDQALIDTERALTRPEGLPGRPWYRHFLYAPGLTTGYGVKTLPGVREAIEQRSFETADAQIRVAAEVLVRCAERVEEAADLLGSASRYYRGSLCLGGNHARARPPEAAPDLRLAPALSRSNRRPRRGAAAHPARGPLRQPGADAAAALAGWHEDLVAGAFEVRRAQRLGAGARWLTRGG